MPKEGVYYVDSGTAIVTKDNINTFMDDIRSKTEEIEEMLLIEYLELK